MVSSGWGSNSGGTSLSPGQGTKIPHDSQSDQNKIEKNHFAYRKIDCYCYSYCYIFMPQIQWICKDIVIYLFFLET